MSGKSKPKQEVTEKIDIKSNEIDKVLKWKIFFDTQTQKVIAIQKDGATGLVASDLETPMPEFINKPQWVEIREAVMIIKKGKLEK